MRLLLDSHALLWFCEGNASLSAPARAAIEDFSHYRELLTMPFHHRDPFDRLLIAQASREGLTLVSKDPHFAAYGVSLLW